jgi:hypothetical protein
MEKFRGEVFLVHKGIVDLNKLKEPIAEVRPQHPSDLDRIDKNRKHLI